MAINYWPGDSWFVINILPQKIKDLKFRFKQFELEDKNSAMKVGTDAVLLGSWVEINGAKTILDIGTGSGIIALMLAQRANAEITAIDIHNPSISDATENFKNSLWSNQLSAINISLQDFGNSNSNKFDLIVSNPPFFSNSLTSPSKDKSLAKHNTSLSQNDLLKSVLGLLNENGRFCVILPENEISSFTISATKLGFYSNKQIRVVPKQGKAINRVITVFSLHSYGSPEISELVIRDKNNEYTQEYKSLTKDFYLKF